MLPVLHCWMYLSWLWHLPTCFLLGLLIVMFPQCDWQKKKNPWETEEHKVCLVKLKRSRLNSRNEWSKIKAGSFWETISFKYMTSRPPGARLNPNEWICIITIFRWKEEKFQKPSTKTKKKKKKKEFTEMRHGSWSYGDTLYTKKNPLNNRFNRKKEKHHQCRQLTVLREAIIALWKTNGTEKPANCLGLNTKTTK